METATKKHEEILASLPKLDCGACGCKSCSDLAGLAAQDDAELKKCIHIADKLGNKEDAKGCFMCAKEASGLGEKMEWKDNLKRDFDFILDCFPDEPGPKETILPYNPALIKELGVKKGDVMIGRPMGMSCGCPITHCGIVSAADARNGVINWNVTGPLRPRAEGFVDIGYYVSQAYEGIIKESKVEIKQGMRYWFLPRRCMLQWRHSGLVNAVTKLRDGSYKVRIEGLLIG
ncbi:(Fe-S)-binding protein [uncultured Acetobacteroides sp.]|uniref:(Fe-S)-binding protein n=1 Tax=uncultured Acetobacteroides sp. TaxID=1760811 RepID=UPI0029F466FA|nr:(Fe-S)-binding protein [uncultured Acetobacteroides sp.]